ncbi:MAG TPA: ABC transporter substrate-binding protein [Anaerolineae bacterium]
MGRHIRWQAIITFTGIAMTMAFLGFLAFSRTTITVPDVGGTYREGIAGTPQFINPLLAEYNQVDQDIAALIFNGLTRADGRDNLEPDLAQSWTLSEDGLAYVFKLRRDIRWQDGQPFTADDVLFTIGLMQDPDFPGVPSLGRLWRTVIAEKLDDYSVRFRLSEPFPAFADFTTIGILPEHILKEIPARDLLNHPFNLEPVGTGPFVLDEINTQFARLSVNPFYAGAKPRLARLELHFYPSYQETIVAFQNGEVQGIANIPPQAIPDVQSIEGLNLYTSRMSGYDIIYLNLQAPERVPFLQEVEVRQALVMALDRQAIIDQVLHGQGLVATGPIRPWSWAYNAKQPVIEFDPDQARTLLDEAGWVDSDGDGLRDKDGQPLTFELLSSDDLDRITVAEVVRQQWQQVGVSVTVEVVGAGLGERLVQRDFDAALAEVLLTGDPDPYPLWHFSQIEGGQNYAGWNNDEASRLLEEGRAVTNQGRRSDFYYEFQKIFAEDVPSFILFYPVYTYGVSQDVFDVQLAPMTNPSDRFRTLPNWYVLTRRVIFTEAQYQEVEPQ